VGGVNASELHHMLLLVGAGKAVVRTRHPVIALLVGSRALETQAGGPALRRPHMGVDESSTTCACSDDELRSPRVKWYVCPSQPARA
jgi:hypothetical protein